MTERSRPGRATVAKKLEDEPGRGNSLRRRCALTFLLVLAAVSSAGCITVRPEQRAILSDPKMRFQGEARTAAELDHVLENREGSFGGGSVEGGGCGCN